MTTRDYLQLARIILWVGVALGVILLLDTLLLWAGWDGKVAL